METHTRVQIARLTLLLLTLVAGLIATGLIVFVTCTGLQVNPFQENTTSFLYALFTSLFCLALILVLVNLATNISLIADAKIAELKIQPKEGLTQKLLLAFALFAIGIVALLYGGTYWSKEQYTDKLCVEAQQVINENSTLLKEINALLVSGKFKDYKKIAEICRFLDSQRRDLPSVEIVYTSNFEGKSVYRSIDRDYSYSACEKDLPVPSYFPCTENFDCEYLQEFFSGKQVSTLKRYKFPGEQFAIYLPFVEGNSRFIILFRLSHRLGSSREYERTR